jgi:hypothetical protein
MNLVPAQHQQLLGPDEDHTGQRASPGARAAAAAQRPSRRREQAMVERLSSPKRLSSPTRRAQRRLEAQALTVIEDHLGVLMDERPRRASPGHAQRLHRVHADKHAELEVARRTEQLLRRQMCSPGKRRSSAQHTARLHDDARRQKERHNVKREKMRREREDAEERVVAMVRDFHGSVKVRTGERVLSPQRAQRAEAEAAENEPIWERLLEAQRYNEMALERKRSDHRRRLESQPKKGCVPGPLRRLAPLAASDMNVTLLPLLGRRRRRRR